MACQMLRGSWLLMLSRDPLLLREWVAIACKGQFIVSSPCVLHKLGRDGGMGFCG